MSRAGYNYIFGETFTFHTIWMLMYQVSLFRVIEICITTVHTFMPRVNDMYYTVQQRMFFYDESTVICWTTAQTVFLFA